MHAKSPQPSREKSKDQRGYSLVEMMVAMTIFLMFMAIFTTVMVQMIRSSAATETRAQSATSVSIAFQNIDRSVRYVSQIDTPGTGASGSTYIEFYTDANSTSNAQATCTQWRYNPTARTLAVRRWNTTNGHDGAPGSWSVKATNVAGPSSGMDAADYPFKLISGTGSQELELTLRVGSDAYKAISTANTRFVARNSTAATPTTPICTTGARS